MYLQNSHRKRSSCGLLVGGPSTTGYFDGQVKVCLGEGFSSIFLLVDASSRLSPLPNKDSSFSSLLLFQAERSTAFCPELLAEVKRSRSGAADGPSSLLGSYCMHCFVTRIYWQNACDIIARGRGTGTKKPD
jgi:hypothetical protein